MGSGMRNKKDKSMPAPNWSQEDWESINFCIKNNIIISPIKKGDNYKVGVAIGDYRKINFDNFEYDAEQAWDKVLEYAKYYHVKYREKSNK